IGFPAGSGADILGRYFTAKLGEQSGQAIIVENKPGANSNIAAGLVANAKPDGYTALFIANSNMAGSRFLFKDLPFDTVKDFVPAASFAQIAFFVVVAPDSPHKSLADLTAYLKSRDRNRYGVTNQMAIITTEYYRQRTGFEATQVQYRTAPDALPDVQNGTLDFVIMDGTFAAGPIQQGKIRALAVTTKMRHPSLPDVPTMQEAGLENFELAPWWGVYFPAATPPDIVAKVGGWMNKISATEDAAQFLARVGSFPLVEDGKTAAARLQADIKLWAPIVAAAKIEPQ
ncbi:MAG: Bug family tripartite tricarboxylate transporter substrate binding protein, partial [Xanthobacteraceae bacterium]